MDKEYFDVIFIILHYSAYEITCTAIEYLKKLNDKKWKAVVVDNGSPNQSGYKLKKAFESDDSIDVVIVDENLGFSRGNNIGYSYARNKYDTRCYVVMNNDIFIKDADFICKLGNVIEESDDEIISPDIIGKNSLHQSPFRLSMITAEELDRIYNYNRKINKIFRVPLLNSIIVKLLDVRRNHKNTTDNYSDSVQKNIVPHGACVIYSRKWITKEDIAFCPMDSMYMEEDILAYYAATKGYSIGFYPQITVHHVEDASTDYSMKSLVKKRLFISENMVRSALVLKQLMGK